MQREWRDPRDGQKYRVEVEPVQSVPDQAHDSVGTDRWRLWFHAAEAPNAQVAAGVAKRLGEVADRDLQQLLDHARGYATVDVDDELVTFYVHRAGQPMDMPPGSEPEDARRHPLVLSGRGVRSSAMLASPAPKEKIEEYDSDELRDMWRKWLLI